MPSDYCERAPEGWSCSRSPHHSGPCALTQVEEATGHAAILRVVDASGVEWNVAAFLTGEARGEMGATAPLEEILQPGAKVSGIKVITNG